MSDSTNPHRKSGLILLGLAWAIIFGGVYWFFDRWETQQTNPNQAHILQSQQTELALIRNRQGHYVAEGTINGEPVTFLLDTGATDVALSMALAKQLNLKRGAAVTLQTANGYTVGYQTWLHSVQIGPLEINDVGATVSEGLTGKFVLLGMSFLKRVEFTQRGDQLILKPLS